VLHHLARRVGDHPDPHARGGKDVEQRRRAGERLDRAGGAAHVGALLGVGKDHAAL